VTKYRPDALDRLFHALGDTTRRGMVERLVRGPASVSEIARPLTWSLPTVVQHLGVLQAAGVVTSSKVGRVRTYQLATDALLPAAEWIGHQRLPAERRLDRLESHLANQTNKEKMK
jgi:DNA-binding transcriptional ArsR family regulator